MTKTGANLVTARGNRAVSFNGGRAASLDNIVQVIIYILLISLSLVIVLPCLYIVALSFNDGADAARGGVYLWPRIFTLDNYREVFANGKIMRYYSITIARTVIGTISSLLVTTLAAYALKHEQMPGKKILTMLITFTMIFGGGTIPTYIQYNSLGLLDSFWVYIVPSLVSVTYLMMLRTSFESIPASLEESAELDGCGFFWIYTRIMLPLSKPTIAVVALYCAVGHWNDWFAGAFYMSSDELWPVQTYLQQMLSRATAAKQQASSVSQAIAQSARGTTSDSLKMATVIITTVPILVMYPFIQKYFTQGALVGAVKE